jgi:GTP-binding protein Era
VTFVCILIDPNKKDCLSNFLLNKDLYLGSPNPPLIILNKVDLLRDKKDLLPLLEKLQTLGFFCVYLISAAKNKGVSDLKKYFFKNAPLGDWLYEKERITDRSSQLLAEDMTREQLYQFLHEEIPYSLAVQTESWRETEQSLVLHQTILLTRRNQKSIVLGPGGELLKKIGTLARISISRLINKKTHLYLHIKVKPKKFL